MPSFPIKEFKQAEFYLVFHPDNLLHKPPDGTLVVLQVTCCASPSCEASLALYLTAPQARDLVTSILARLPGDKV